MEQEKVAKFNPEQKLDHSLYDAEWKKIGKSVDNIHLIHDFVNKNDLELFLNYVKKYENDENFKGGNDKRKEDVLKENPLVFELMEKYESLIYDKAKEFYTDTYGVKLKRFPINSIHFVRWPIGMSSGLHADCERPNGEPAFHAQFYRLNISCLLYLNDNYEGGELDFPDYNFKFKPKAGDLAIFPSNHRHLITEVKGGNRFTMPLWFAFDLPELIDFSGQSFDAEHSVLLWHDEGDKYNRDEAF